MARVFVTGSTDGLGLMAARLLVETGHTVVLHARNAARAADARRSLPESEAVVIGDLASLSETRSVADQVNRLGRCDAVIHNARVGLREDWSAPRKDCRTSSRSTCSPPTSLRPSSNGPSGSSTSSCGNRTVAPTPASDIDWRRRRSRLRRLFREQAPRRAARFRRGQALAGRAVEHVNPAG